MCGFQKLLPTDWKEENQVLQSKTKLPRIAPTPRRSCTARTVRGLGSSTAAPSRSRRAAAVFAAVPGKEGPACTPRIPDAHHS